MRMRWIGLAVMGVALAAASGARAQSCDDFNTCTVSDMCTDGMCSGTFQGGSCDDFDDCTVNDRCQMDPDRGPICKGDPGEPGTPCQNGCGVCTQLVPLPGVPLTCSGDTADNGMACDASNDGPCLEGSCVIQGAAGFTIALCLPHQKSCPQAAGCKGACNPNTGNCDNSLSYCSGDCERCEQNQCVPINQGKACTDFDPCTPQSSCQTLGGRGLCLGGVPSGNTPTPTATGLASTPTATVGTPGACVGDCNHDVQVAINELIIGVNIALGSSDVSSCPSFDVNGDGSVAINELIGGVNAALNGCVG